MSELVEVAGRQFIPTAELAIPHWGSASGDRPQPTLTIKDDDLFLITDTVGNIADSGVSHGAIGTLGLFCRDTRFLSRLEMQIEHQSPILLASSADSGFAIQVLCANPYISDEFPAETLGIEREIVLNGGMFEEITIHNYSTKKIECELSISFAADFADLFEVRGSKRDRRGTPWHEVHAQTGVLDTSPNGFTLAYRGLDDVFRESRLEFCHQLPARFHGYTAVWHIELAPHDSCQLGYRLQMLLDERPASRVAVPATLSQAKAAELEEEREWQDRITRITTSNPELNRAIERAQWDIYLLRQSFDRRKVLSAGVPWFSTLFGRDAAIVAMQTLILDASIAKETLFVLAEYQGREFNGWREEEPGKILHEIRFGEMARCGEIPHTPYYGTIDATPLWLMLYAEYYAWTHDRETIDRLWPNALAAMEWIDRRCRDTGYLSYNRQSPRGLANQGWKDSGDCIVDRHGKMASGSIALCEVQAYVYAAKTRLSEIAILQHDSELAEKWQLEAEGLKQRFNRDFWMPDLDYLALALDGEGNQVDSVTSNPGQCLMTGILEEEKARSVAERLLAPDLFSGWGLRTLSSDSPAYNPMGYHTGSVWPHDNALAILGLRAIGQVEPALSLAQSTIEAILQQPYCRPPELFCGYQRTPHRAPIPYPVACSPQAWATGSVFQILQMMVNLIPNVANNQVRIIHPSLLPSLERLSIKNLRISSTVMDLEITQPTSQDGDTETFAACRVKNKRGNLRVTIEDDTLA
jgi:glycogen debranching enzyme